MIFVLQTWNILSFISQPCLHHPLVIVSTLIVRINEQYFPRFSSQVAIPLQFYFSPTLYFKSSPLTPNMSVSDNSQVADSAKGSIKRRKTIVPQCQWWSSRLADFPPQRVKSKPLVEMRQTSYFFEQCVENKQLSNWRMFGSQFVSFSPFFFLILSEFDPCMVRSPHLFEE